MEILSAEVWSTVLAVNLTGAFHCTKAALPVMRAAGGGLIIYISSIAAHRADLSGAAYQARKRGLLGLAHATRLEEKSHRIRRAWKKKTIVFEHSSSSRVCAGPTSCTNARRSDLVQMLPNNNRPGSSSLASDERLLDIRNNVVDVFEPCRNADESRQNPNGQPLLLGE
jgi:NADP-dependent 3-hydroxy acid dehydrogenase YdfG